MRLLRPSAYCSLNALTTPQPYPLSLHDALPIYLSSSPRSISPAQMVMPCSRDSRISSCVEGPYGTGSARAATSRSEEHTSELQSRQYLVCRLLLEKKNAGRYALYGVTETRTKHL